jgi:hypothetical protein
LVAGVPGGAFGIFVTKSRKQNGGLNPTINGHPFLAISSIRRRDTARDKPRMTGNAGGQWTVMISTTSTFLLTRQRRRAPDPTTNEMSHFAGGAR